MTRQPAEELKYLRLDLGLVQVRRMILNHLYSNNIGLTYHFAADDLAKRALAKEVEHFIALVYAQWPGNRTGEHTGVNVRLQDVTNSQDKVVVSVVAGTRRDGLTALREHTALPCGASKSKAGHALAVCVHNISCQAHQWLQTNNGLRSKNCAASVAARFHVPQGTGFAVAAYDPAAAV